MKFLKLSLAASVALGALSTASFAQPLEEAIKGVDVSGYLRYRYNDDRFDNGDNDVEGSNATHQWKAVADFKTPVVNGVALNLGILYHNNNQNVNHGKGQEIAGQGEPEIIDTSLESSTGTGLGAGKDSEFGVSTFFATIAPDSTATTVMIGKQRLNTPLTSAADDDRGTGILALNSDIEGLTLAAGAFDSWALDDLDSIQIEGQGVIPDQNIDFSNGSVDLPLYTAAAIYGIDTSFGNFGAQGWIFNVQDLVDVAAFLDFTWKYSMFNARAQYLIAGLDSSNGNLVKFRDIAVKNDLAVIEGGIDLREINLPLDFKLGYMTNFQDGVTVSFDDEGSIAKAGKLWWQNRATGITFGLGERLGGGNIGAGYYLDANGRRQAGSQDIDVIYGALGYSLLDERLKLGLEAVWGANVIEGQRFDRTGRAFGGVTGYVEFLEITPTISWKHSDKLTISGYYAMLSTSDERKHEAKAPDQDRNRARVEVKYSF